MATPTATTAPPAQQKSPSRGRPVAGGAVVGGIVGATQDNAAKGAAIGAASGAPTPRGRALRRGDPHLHRLCVHPGRGGTHPLGPVPPGPKLGPTWKSALPSGSWRARSSNSRMCMGTLNLMCTPIRSGRASRPRAPPSRTPIGLDRVEPVPTATHPVQGEPLDLPAAMRHRLPPRGTT